MTLRREWLSLQIAVACIDGCAIALTYVLVFVIPSRVPEAASSVRLSSPPALAIAVYVLGWWALLMIYRLYEPEHLLDGVQQYTRVIRAASTGLLLVSFVAFLVGRSITWPWLVISWVLYIFAFDLPRFFVRRLAWYLRRHGHFQPRMLIIGAGEDGLSVAQQLSGYSKVAGQVVGYLDEYSPIGAQVAGGRVLGDPLALARIVRETDATDAIILPQAVSWESLQALLQGGARQWGLQRLWLAPSFRDLLTTGLEVHQCGSLPLLSVAGPRIIGLEKVLKRALDLCLVLLALPVALPLGLGIAIWLAGARRIAPLARRPIIGRNQRPCVLLTFAPLPALQLLHLWRLPMLLNVLRGDLTLVGPRPIDSSLEPAYRPWLVMLTSVRPGLVGPWWLVKGSRRNSMPDEVNLDLSYIRHYTIWFDLQLLGLLVRRAITGNHKLWTATSNTTRGLEYDGAS